MKWKVTLYNSGSNSMKLFMKQMSEAKSIALSRNQIRHLSEQIGFLIISK